MQVCDARPYLFEEIMAVLCLSISTQIIPYNSVPIDASSKVHVFTILHISSYINTEKYQRGNK